MTASRSASGDLGGAFHRCPLLTVDGPIGAHATVHTRQAGELMTNQSVTGRRSHRVPDDQVIDEGLGESFPR